MFYDAAFPPEDFSPYVKQNLCLIVVGVAIQDNHVLLIQEAKQSCRGKYYLPAGRVEVHETLTDAVRREVLEESGLHFEPKQISLIESNGPFWLSITFWGEIVGGSLKTVADEESLEGRWFHLDQVRELELACFATHTRRPSLPHYEANSHPRFCLRAPVVHMIDASLRCDSSNPFLRDFLPSKPALNLQCLIYRLVIVWVLEYDATPSHLLVRRRDASLLPAFRLNGGSQIGAITTYLRHLFSPDVAFCSTLCHAFDRRRIRVLDVNFSPRCDTTSALKIADGLRLTLLVVLNANQKLLPLTLPDFHWHSLSNMQTVDTSQLVSDPLLKHLTSLRVDDPSLPACIL